MLKNYKETAEFVGFVATGIGIIAVLAVASFA